MELWLCWKHVCLASQHWIYQAWWGSLGTLALRQNRQNDQKFKIIHSYTESLRLVWAAWYPVWEAKQNKGMWWAAQSIVSWFLLHLFGKRCLKPQSQTHRDWPNHRKGNVAELKACMSSPLIINFTMGTQGFDMDARATWLFSQPAQPQALPKST